MNNVKPWREVVADLGGWPCVVMIAVVVVGLFYVAWQWELACRAIGG